MTIFKTISAAAVAATLGVSAASASTIVDFTGTDVTSGIGTSTATFDNGTVSGTINSLITFGFGTGVINQHPTEGLGITRDTLLFPDDPAIDSEISETMVFTFDTTVIFESIMFGFVDPEDDWTIAINGITVADESNVNPFLFAPNTIGNTLTVTAIFTGPLSGGPDTIFGGPDDFNVKSITVAAIPLPATALLLIAGLGGLGIARRRAA